MANEITGSNQSREIQDAIAGARDGLRDALGRSSERASQLKDAALDRASQLRDAAMDRGRTAVSTIERTIDERPFLVLGGVFAGGLILGMLLRRS